MSAAILISSHVLTYAPTIVVSLQTMAGIPHISPTAVPRFIGGCYWSLWVLLPLAIVIYIDEASKPFVGTIATRDCTLLLANLVFTMVACILSQYAPIAESVTLGHLASPEASILANHCLWARLTFSGFVFLGAWSSNDTPVIISPWQVAGHVTALVASRSAFHHCTHDVGPEEIATEQSKITGLYRRANYLGSRVLLALSVWLLHTSIHDRNRKDRYNVYNRLRA